MSDTKVILYSYDPNMERVCAASMRSCNSPYPSHDLYSGNGSKFPLEGEKPFDAQRIESMLRNALESGHHSVLEHSHLTFDIQQVSRSLTHQLVRHRLAAYSQQSQRHVRITRWAGYIRPPSIGDKVTVPISVQGTRFDLTFDDLVDVARQGEEQYLVKGVRAEDARYVRPNASTTNIVTTMNARELLHVLTMRCAPAAQWEIRDVAWAMFACAKIISPNVFRTIPAAKNDPAFQEKIVRLDAAVQQPRALFATSPPGSLVQVFMNGIGLDHPVRAFVRKL